MADVQLSQGYVRLANRLQTAFALARWDSAAQRQLVDALVRVTYGFRRKTAPIGTADWRALTGLSDDQVKRARRALQANGVLVLVAEFDATTSQPSRWALQKDFTRWGKFSVSELEVLAAEEAAAKLHTPPGAPTPPGGADAPRVDEHTQGGEIPPPQGAQTPPPPGAPTPPGAGRNLNNGNDSQGGKDREIQERQKEPTTTRVRGRAEELQALRDYVGATHPEAVDLMARSANHPDGWAGSVLALYGPPAGDELAYRGVAPSDRPPILGKTLLRYAGESQPYNGAFFRSILLRVAGEHRPGKGQEETADEQDQASGEQDNRDAALAAIS